ncbi:MAG TPA: aromatic ring-hydroxylating dioxygenase subunit alpha [Kiloniellales bacterium]|nr:aromatic ring-hydroxylating dioxygenase subunit alpha [Kiloniellales bacterium]
MQNGKGNGVRKVNIAADPGRSRTLPGWAYTDPALYKAEIEQIHYRSWHYAGAIDELKEPGDYITAKIGDENVIVIRDKEGRLGGFYNVCPHRAHQLLRGRGSAKVITCPYHAWSFHADGRLRTARNAEKLIDFQPEEFNLRPVKVEVFCGRFVFYNLDLDAVPLSESAADLAEDLKREIPELDRLVPTKEPLWRAPMQANWKVVVDNFLECYHCRPAHPAFADLVRMDDYRIGFGENWSSQKGELGRLDNKAYPVPDNAPNRKALFWWLWPTTTFNRLPGQSSLNVYCMLPGGLGVTDQVSQLFMLPGETLDEARRAYTFNVLTVEDVNICESVQKGLQSRGYSSGRFIYDPEGSEQNEAAVHHFHRKVADALGINEAS